MEEDAVEATESSDRSEPYLEFGDRQETTADAVEQKPEAESSTGSRRKAGQDDRRDCRKRGGVGCGGGNRRQCVRPDVVRQVRPSAADFQTDVIVYLRFSADVTSEEDDVTGDGGEYRSNGLSSGETPKSGRPDVVSTVGNANVGLELLKKGRLALSEVRFFSSVQTNVHTHCMQHRITARHPSSWSALLSNSSRYWTSIRPTSNA